MSVRLEAIKLNHDSSSATHDALNIREDATTFVDVPEWVRGSSTAPEDAPAAYAIEESRGNTLTIQAKFRNLSEEPREVEIRAVDPTIQPPGPSGCAGLLIRLLRRVLRGLFGNVLGEVKARTVRLPASGTTGFETFELKDPRLWSAGVGVRTTTWRWQYRPSSGGSWTDFETTRHRIYSLLDVPTDPWNQSPHQASNRRLPWTDVLDRSCVWAFLATDRTEAATRVTEAVYDLGPARVEYDCPGGGAPHYSSGGTFDCTAFLDRLDGGTGNGQYVNCSDCATFVSTFANALGCDLWQSKMGWSFDLNPLLAIGSSTWQTACGWGGFNFHEVAWEGGCTASEAIYDACLQVDGDADPTSSPHTPLLPTNMTFGAAGQDYRSRLATPADQADCDPLPGTRARRPPS